MNFFEDLLGVSSIIDFLNTTILETINPTMNGYFLASLPSTLENGRVTNVINLLDEIEFDELV